MYYSQCEPGALGQLTEAVKSRPFSVVLFSNIDVAHPSVIDILIEIVSRGRLTDGQGSTVDFTKTLIIMTSKLGIDKQLTVTCECFPMGGEFLCKEILDRHPSERRDRCDVVRRLELVSEKNMLSFHFHSHQYAANWCFFFFGCFCWSS